MNSASSKASIIAGGLAFFTGLLVITGWYVKSSSLVQIHPTFVPMQYNTAWGFLLCGLGIVFLNLNKQIIAGILGCLVSLVGVVTLIQYIFGINTGFDELFIKDYIQVKTSYPGRMAPNTALCFLLSGLAIASVSEIFGWFSIKSVGLEALGAIISGLGLVALSGYLFDLESAYGWGNLSGMAVHTSTAFIVVGLGLVLNAKQKTADDKKIPFPIFLAVGLLTVSILFSKALLIESEKNEHNLIRSETTAIKRLFSNNLDIYIMGLERMRSRWEKKVYGNKQIWDMDAGNYVTNMKGLQAVEWVDENFIVNWIEPVEGNEKAIGLDLSFEENRKKALNKSKDLRKTVLTEMISLVQGNMGFLSASPIFTEGKFDGFILGVFNVNKVIHAFVNQFEIDGLTIQVIEAKNDYGTEGIIIRGKAGEGYIFQSKIKYQNLEFDVLFRYSEDYFAKNQSPYPLVVGLSGVLLAFSFSLMVFYNRKSKYQAQALAASQNHLTKVIDNMVDGLITINELGIIQSVNPGAQKIFGYRSDELIGQNVSMLMPNPDSEQHDQYLENYLSTGETKIIGFGREVVGLRKDGTVFPMDLAVNTVNDHKGRIFIGTIHDISARKHTEAELEKYRCHLEEKVNERTSALKKINEELEKFTYTASHDLQEPLRKVIIFGDRLRDDFKESLGEKGLGYIERMQKASFRMKALITDLLGYSHLTYHNNDFEIININHIAQEVIEDLEVQIESANGDVQIHDLPQIEADKIQIRQLLQNLISNGLKYSSPDAAPKIVITSAPDGRGSHRISIADNGMGFDEKYKDKIFQPFQRLTSDRDISGTGMGLFICKKIVERHNGAITVSSSLGKGSTFIITLPEKQV